MCCANKKSLEFINTETREEFLYVRVYLNICTLLIISLHNIRGFNIDAILKIHCQSVFIELGIIIMQNLCPTIFNINITYVSTKQFITDFTLFKNKTRIISAMGKRNVPYSFRNSIRE